MSDTTLVRFYATPKDIARMERLMEEAETTNKSDYLRRLIRAEYERAIVVPLTGHKDAISERVGT